MMTIYDVRTGEMKAKEHVAEPNRAVEWSMGDRFVHFFDLHGRRYDVGVEDVIVSELPDVTSEVDETDKQSANDKKACWYSVNQRERKS